MQWNCLEFSWVRAWRQLLVSHYLLCCKKMGCFQHFVTKCPWDCLTHPDVPKFRSLNLSTSALLCCCSAPSPEGTEQCLKDELSSFSYISKRSVPAELWVAICWFPLTVLLLNGLLVGIWSVSMSLQSGCQWCGNLLSWDHTGANECSDMVMNRCSCALKLSSMAKQLI